MSKKDALQGIMADYLVAAILRDWKLLFGIMLHGHVFGERNSGIATLIGIIGIGMIATSNVRLLK